MLERLFSVLAVSALEYLVIALAVYFSNKAFGFELGGSAVAFFYMVFIIIDTWISRITNAIKED